MKALYFDGTKPVYMDQYEKPVPAPGHSLIKVLISAVCNMDIELWDLMDYEKAFASRAFKVGFKF